MGRLSLEEALDLVLLYAEAEPSKFEREAVKWLGRYASERTPSLLEAQFAAAALAALPDGIARERLQELLA